MTHDSGQLESAAVDLALARRQIEAAREALEKAPGGLPEIEAAIARLGRLAADAERVEAVVASRLPVPARATMG